MATHKENPNPSLPEDLIYDILLNLPVESLLRFRSVCKSWLSLISSSSFIQTHLSKSTNDPHHTRHRLILCEWIRCRIFGKYVPSLLTCSVDSLFNESNTRVVDERLSKNLNKRLTEIVDDHDLNTQAVDERLTKILDYEPVPDRWDIDDGNNDIKVKGVVGYCNGLVCLTCINNGVYLWNPTTRIARKLPNLKPRYFESRYRFECHYGFGYDELNDTFKVFAVYDTFKVFAVYNGHNDIGRDYKTYEVSVYCSKSDCWRFIGDFPLDDVPYPILNFKYEVMFANGVLHWVLLNSSYKEAHIISLDIQTEMPRQILRPKYGEGEGEYSWNLGIFGKSLSLLCKFDNHADFWVFNKCGVEESWTKLFTIPYMDTLDEYSCLKPICILVNGDIILHLSEADMNATILLYNPKDNTFKELVEMDFCGDLLYNGEGDVYTYVESLVSPQL